MEKNKEAAASKEKKKPHCLILPYPIQGHINPILQFSKRLSHNSIKITLAAPKRLPLNDFPASVSVETISDGYDDGLSPDEPMPQYLHRFRQVGMATLSRLLERLRESGSAVDCIVYDAFLPWGLDVAKEFGVFGAHFFTQLNIVNAIYYSVFRGEIRVPVSDKEAMLISGIPRLEASDLPTFVVDHEERYPGAVELMLGQFKGVEDAHFVLVNSVYEMEEEATDYLRRFMPVKTIGPTIPSMYLDKRLAQDTNYGLSIFKPTHTCMEWLQQKPPMSVIYISFGSMARLKEQQMEELATSLILTNKPFLWVVRSSEESKLPKNFVHEASDKGLIVSWCPQLEVLAHEAVGCFITHCGWNSTLEALSLGVPMVGVPWWSDQTTNAKLVMDVWKMGIRACPNEDGIVGSEEIVSCVKYVMEGERAQEIRENARKWKDLIKEAVDEGGSSDRNIQEFVSTIIGVLPS